MTKTTLQKLERFAEQTSGGTEVYEGNETHHLVQVGEIATLMEWLDKNRYDEEIFDEGVRLVQNVEKYRSLDNLPGRRK
jgi:hypothetical protein